MTRDEILRRLEEWVDEALAAEEPPRGIDAEILESLAGGGAAEVSEGGGSCDSYALWSAMTALVQEVKLQGRTFKELNETLGGQAGRIADELRAVYRERERDVERETERRCRKEALGVLVDLRDRLDRGAQSVRAVEVENSKQGRGWLERLFSRETDHRTGQTLQALTKGYGWALERVDRALADANAREIVCQGQIFDPRRMNAVESEESSTVPEGTVLEVYRSGYEWNGEVFRPAQVKVSCAPAVERTK